MKKVNLIVSETFQSRTEQELKANLQKAVDQYLILAIKNGGLPTGNSA